MVATATVLAQYVSNERWGVAAFKVLAGAETVVQLAGNSLTDIVPLGNKVVIEGMTIKTQIAAGGSVLSTLRGGAFYTHYFDTFTAAATVPTAKAYYPLNLPLNLSSSPLVYVISSWAAADDVYISVWGKWQPSENIEQVPPPQPVYVDGPADVTIAGIKLPWRK